MLRDIDSCIKKYNLSKENKDGFLNLRKDYNEGERAPIRFYTLICYAFNYQIRFNRDGEYNMPFGKNRSCFNSSLRQKFVDFAEALHGKDCSFTNVSFEQFEFEDFDSSDFVYCDPPYFNSVASCNERNGRTEGHEQKLLELLDKLNDKGIKFGLSNNLKYKNLLLDEWKNKYRIHYLSANYSNCNYHKSNKEPDVEVFITNY